MHSVASQVPLTRLCIRSRATARFCYTSFVSLRVGDLRGVKTTSTCWSAQNPGPVERKLKDETAKGVHTATIDLSSSAIASAPSGQKQYSAKMRRLADEVANLTLLETLDLTELLKEKLGLASSDLMMPFSGGMGVGGGGAVAPGAAAALPTTNAAATPAAAPAKEEKTHVDIKLTSFDAKNKIKVIKEVRAVTSLGLKEAKDLVEGAPCIIMAKVKREDAGKIVEKLKAETGGEFLIE